MKFYLFHTKIKKPLRIQNQLSLGRTEGDQQFPQDIKMSRLHCILRDTGTLLSIEDLDSKNGVLVGGKLIPPGVPTPLHEGDKITIGDQEYILKIEVPDQKENRSIGEFSKTEIILDTLNEIPLENIASNSTSEIKLNTFQIEQEESSEINVQSQWNLQESVKFSPVSNTPSPHFTEEPISLKVSSPTHEKINNINLLSQSESERKQYSESVNIGSQANKKKIQRDKKNNKRKKRNFHLFKTISWALIILSPMPIIYLLDAENIFMIMQLKEMKTIAIWIGILCLPLFLVVFPITKIREQLGWRNGKASIILSLIALNSTASIHFIGIKMIEKAMRIDQQKYLSKIKKECIDNYQPANCSKVVFDCTTCLNSLSFTQRRAFLESIYPFLENLAKSNDDNSLLREPSPVPLFQQKKSDEK